MITRESMQRVGVREGGGRSDAGVQGKNRGSDPTARKGTDRATRRVWQTERPRSLGAAPARPGQAQARPRPGPAGQRGNISRGHSRKTVIKIIMTSGLNNANFHVGHTPQRPATAD